MSAGVEICIFSLAELRSRLPELKELCDSLGLKITVTQVTMILERTTPY